MSATAAIRNLKATINREVKLRREFQRKFDNALKEIACLRSVLSEWDCDKTCYVQWIRANDIADSREEAK